MTQEEIRLKCLEMAREIVGDLPQESDSEVAAAKVLAIASRLLGFVTKGKVSDG